jgi:hypothetical protein
VLKGLFPDSAAGAQDVRPGAREAGQGAREHERGRRAAAGRPQET